MVLFVFNGKTKYFKHYNHDQSEKMALFSVKLSINITFCE